jgi:hypothetical protein
MKRSATLDSSKRVKTCIDRLMTVVLANPAARLRYGSNSITVLLELTSGTLTVVGTVDLAGERATVELMDVINRVKLNKGE